MAHWNEFENALGYFTNCTWPIERRIEWIDINKFDIVPKKSYITEQLKASEEQITYYEDKIKELVKHIEELKTKL